MSDHYTRWIPSEPPFVPTEENAARAAAWLREQAPEAEINVTRGPDIRLVDCGSNLDSIRCPRCDAELKIEWWQEAMDRAYDTKFENRVVHLPCCGADDRLESLRYDALMGFARFVLEIRDVNIEATGADEIIAHLLGTPVLRIVAHY